MGYFDRVLRALKDGTSAGADKAWETRRGGSNAPPEKSEYARGFYKDKQRQMMQDHAKHMAMVPAINPGGKAYAEDMRNSIEEDQVWEAMAHASFTGGKATAGGLKRQMKSESSGLLPLMFKTKE